MNPIAHTRLAQRLFSTSRKEERRIVSAVCTVHEVTLDQVLSQDRSRPLPSARKAIMILARSKGLTTQRAAALAGLTDHGSTIHALRHASHPSVRLAECQAALDREAKNQLITRSSLPLIAELNPNPQAA